MDVVPVEATGTTAPPARTGTAAGGAVETETESGFGGRAGRGTAETGGEGGAPTGTGAAQEGARPLPTTQDVGKGVQTGDAARRSATGRQTFGSRSRRPR